MMGGVWASCRHLLVVLPVVHQHLDVPSCLEPFPTIADLQQAGETGCVPVVIVSMPFVGKDPVPFSDLVLVYAVPSGRSLKPWPSPIS